MNDAQLQEWIAFADRKPTEADLPILVCDGPGGDLDCFTTFIPTAWEFWSRVIVPAFPQRPEPKPEPKTRPWSKPDDVPGPVCWVRTSASGGKVECLVVCISTTGISTLSRVEQFIPWSDAGKMETLEYSTDRKTWQPCTVTEGSAE